MCVLRSPVTTPPKTERVCKTAQQGRHRAAAGGDRTGGRGPRGSVWAAQLILCEKGAYVTR